MAFTSKYVWKDEVPLIKALGAEGLSMVVIAEKYEVSRQRMKQIIDKYIPEWGTTYGAAVNRKLKADKKYAKWGVKEDTELYDAQRMKFRRKKANVKKAGVGWGLLFGDLSWPQYCPILGMELDYFAEKTQENSPSFDQIIAGDGYVKGNVQIISWRANRIKNDGTPEEHLLIAEYMKRVEFSKENT